MDELLRIKRLVMRGQVRFTVKAYAEMYADGIEPDDVRESLLNAQKIDKVLRSRRTPAHRRAEKLYVVKSFNFTGALIYTKGKIAHEPEGEVYYVLVSSKIATYGE